MWSLCIAIAAHYTGPSPSPDIGTNFTQNHGGNLAAAYQHVRSMLRLSSALQSRASTEGPAASKVNTSVQTAAQNRVRQVGAIE